MYSTTKKANFFKKKLSLSYSEQVEIAALCSLHLKQQQQQQQQQQQKKSFLMWGVKKKK